MKKKADVLTTLEAMRDWPYWQEVYLNCVKESPLSYEAFARAVQGGDPSRMAFDNALRESQMTEEFFQTYLPEFQRFMALYKRYGPLGMLSDGVDQIWHGFMLISDRYREFCLHFFGYMVDHLPCSLYEIYGVDAQSSCLNKCVPSSCRGNGGGCNSNTPNFHRDTDPEATKASILAGTQTFVDAYTAVFGTKPDLHIWNQLIGQ